MSFLDEKSSRPQCEQPNQNQELVKEKPLVHIGWVATHDGRDSFLHERNAEAASQLEKHLGAQFPIFQWQVDFVSRRRYASEGISDPVDLLEIGLHEKTAHNWDYALVITPNELLARSRFFTLGAPSSALETAVLTTLWFNDPELMPRQLVALALYFLGHMWGLPLSKEGVMDPPIDLDELQPLPFSEDEQRTVIDRLEEVSDTRLEDDEHDRSPLGFVWHTFWSDPKSILQDVIGYRPWRQPFQLGGLTAAAFATTLLLFLGAEAWELGVHSGLFFLSLGSILSVGGSSVFLYHGQNMGELTRTKTSSEQLARSHIIVMACLVLGMMTLWVILFAVSLTIAMSLPGNVIGNWISAEASVSNLSRFAAFAATLGVAAGALGGNLEDEGRMKAKFFFDEES